MATKGCFDCWKNDHRFTGATTEREGDPLCARCARARDLEAGVEPPAAIDVALAATPAAEFAAYGASRCEFVKGNGVRCATAAKKGQQFCRHHENGVAAPVATELVTVVAVGLEEAKHEEEEEVPTATTIITTKPTFKCTCENPECGKEFLAPRAGKKACSQKCMSRAWYLRNSAGKAKPKAEPAPPGKTVSKPRAQQGNPAALKPSAGARESGDRDQVATIHVTEKQLDTFWVSRTVKEKGQLFSLFISFE